MDTGGEKIGESRLFLQLIYYFHSSLKKYPVHKYESLSLLVAIGIQRVEPKKSHVYGINAACS